MKICSAVLQFLHVNRQTYIMKVAYTTLQLLFANTPTKETERHSRVGNISSSYSGGPGFESRGRRPAILTEGFRGFPQSLHAKAGIVPYNQATNASYQILSSSSSFTYHLRRYIV
jgi:hypothetical protein